MTLEELLNKAQSCLPGAKWSKVAGESYIGFEVQLFSAEYDDYLGVYIMEDGSIEAAHGSKPNPPDQDPFAWLRGELLSVKRRVNLLLTGEEYE